jgi:hypothetical protein
MYAGLGQKLSGWGAMIGQSTSIRGKKSADQKNILEIFWLIRGRFYFSLFLNISYSKADSKYVPNYGFECKDRPIAGSKVKNRHFLSFFPFRKKKFFFALNTQIFCFLSAREKSKFSKKRPTPLDLV